MAVSFPSALIRYHRLERSWSQEGLCAGICAVSYLSKIEQGKAEPNADILSALMQRLEIRWHPEAAQEASALVEELWEAIVSMDSAEEQRLRKQLAQERERYVNGPHMLDVLLLERLKWNAVPPVESDDLLPAFENCFDSRQRAWYLLAQDRCEEAFILMPNAFVSLNCGSAAYHAGSYTLAMERLLQSCALAAEEGRARVLMLARTLLGNCYSDQSDYAAMRRHYQTAARLARDLGDEDIVNTIRYNTAATELQLGHYEKAYAAFAGMKNPSAIVLHKKAICEEKLGRPQEALQTLALVEKVQNLHIDSADFPDRGWIDRFCQLVRYRLEHPDYLRDQAYGDLLISAYRDMQQELPHGFALFHQPWVEEWYVATRQYKQAYELKR